MGGNSPTGYGADWGVVFAVAAGWESVAHWGGRDSGSNRYGVPSKWMTPNADPRAAAFPRPVNRKRPARG